VLTKDDERADIDVVVTMKVNRTSDDILKVAGHFGLLARRRRRRHPARRSARRSRARSTALSATSRSTSSPRSVERVERTPAEHLHTEPFR